MIADKVYVKVKDISMFVSKANGISLDQSYKEYENVIILPKQLENGVDEEVVETTAKNAKQIMFVVFVLQVTFQYLLKGIVKLIMELFLGIQLIVYITLFEIQIPSIAELVLLEFKKLLEFEAANPESMIKLFNPDFDLKNWLSGVKKYINED